MAGYKIKPCYLSEADQISLKSILELCQKRLHTPWQLVEKGQADLCVYSLNNPDSLAAFNQHSTGFSAAISNQDTAIDNVDIILKKPLRSNNLAQVLNKVEEKIKFNSQAQEIAQLESGEQTAAGHDKKSGIAKQTSSFLSSLSANISSHLHRKKGPAVDLPALDFSIPTQVGESPDTLLDAELLKKWFDDLAEKDSSKIVSSILTNLLPLNRAQINSEQRLALLEIYRKPISRLVFERDIVSIRREIESPTEFQKDINALNQLLEELTLGYKIILIEAYQQGKRPTNNDLFLLAISRVAELTNLIIVNAFRYYRSPPENALNGLHQLFIYCEASQILDQIAVTKTARCDYSFFHYYCQIMLTCIADPYSLAKFDIFRLYKLIERVADKVIINPLTESQKQLSNKFAVMGQFYIDCSTDHGPFDLAKTELEQRKLASARIFNSQQAVQDIEQMINSFDTRSNHVSYDLDIKLLSKILPQFSTSYERKFHRIASSKGRNIQLANGVDAIYHSLDAENDKVIFEWVMTNQSSEGIMAFRHKDEIQALNNGDFMGVFEHDLPVKLATVRWLYMAADSTVQIGLQIHPGRPSAVSFTADGETEIILGLLLPEIDDIKQPPTLIANKGTFSPNRHFRIKDDDTVYTINAKELIDSTLSYEQFTFVKHQTK